LMQGEQHGVVAWLEPAVEQRREESLARELPGFDEPVEDRTGFRTGHSRLIRGKPTAGEAGAILSLTAVRPCGHIVRCRQMGYRSPGTGGAGGCRGSLR